MKCVDRGTLQAYLDGELDFAAKKQLDGHLAVCAHCERQLGELKTAEDFSFEKLSHYKQFNENLAVPASKNNVRMKGRQSKSHLFIGLGGINSMFKKYGKFVAMFCLAVLVTTCLTVAPVRAFIANALNIFRVENVKGINITMKDMESIKNQLQARQETIDIDNFIHIQPSGFENKAIGADEARKIDTLTVILPEENDPSLAIWEVGSGSIDFTLNVDKVNEMLKSFGAEKLLPASVNDKTFTAVFEKQLSVDYVSGSSHYSLLEMKAPSLNVPSDVDEDELYECLVAFPLIPDDIKQQLKTIQDWKSTVYFPMVGSNSQKVDINGAEGIVNSDGNSMALVWYNEGTIYTLTSNAGIDQTIEFARSLR